MNTAGSWTGCGGGVPQDGDALTFPATLNSQDLNNDIVGLETDQIIISDTYSFTGNAISISGGSSIEGHAPGIVFDLPIIGSSNFGVLAENDITFTNTINLNGFNFILDTQTTGWIRFQDVISGTGNITVYGQGEVSLEAANTFVGGIDILEGNTLYLTNNASLGGTGNLLTASDTATVYLDGDGLVIPNDMGLDAGTNLVNDTGTNELSGVIDIIDVTGNSVVFNVNTGLRLSGNLVGDGAFVKRGTATLTFTNVTDNTLTGSMSVEGGYIESIGAVSISGSTFYIGNGTDPAAFSSYNNEQIADTTDVVVAIQGSFGLNGGNETIKNLYIQGYLNTGGGTLTLNNLYMVGGMLDNGTINITGSEMTFAYDEVYAQYAVVNSNIDIGTNNISLSTYPSTNPQVASLNGEIIGSGNITITEDPDTRIEFWGNSLSFSGTLILQGGTTYISSDFGIATVSINGGTLQGDAGVIGHLLGYSGNFFPGLPVSTYTIGNLDIASALSTYFNINGNSQGVDYDYLQVSNVANIAGTLIIDLTVTPTVGDTFTILHADSGINGTFDNAPEGWYVHSMGQSFRVNYTANDVILTAVGGPFELFNNTFIATPSNPLPNQPFTVTSIWSSDPGAPIPGGSAELFDGTTSLGTVSLINGVATFNIVGLPSGSHSLTVVYSGDGLFGGAVSNPLILGSLAGTGIELPISLMTLTLITFVGIIIYKKYE